MPAGRAVLFRRPRPQPFCSLQSPLFNSASRFPPKFYQRPSAGPGRCCSAPPHVPPGAASPFFLTGLCSRCMPARSPLHQHFGVCATACLSGRGPQPPFPIPSLGPNFADTLRPPVCLCAALPTQKAKKACLAIFLPWLPSVRSIAPPLTRAAAPCFVCVSLQIWFLRAPCHFLRPERPHTPRSNQLFWRASWPPPPSLVPCSFILLPSICLV